MKTILPMLLLSMIVVLSAKSEGAIAADDNEVNTTTEEANAVEPVPGAEDESADVGVAALKEAIEVLSEQINSLEKRVAALENGRQTTKGIPAKASAVPVPNAAAPKKAVASKVSSAPIEPGSEVTAEQLCKDFLSAKGTPGLFDKRYRSVCFVVKGVVDEFEKRVGETRTFNVFLRTPDKSLRTLAIINFADFDTVEMREKEGRIVGNTKSADRAVTLIRLGEMVSIEGTCQGKQVGGIQMDNCILQMKEK